MVREYGSRFEVRLYDGLSTGLFLDHREHRRALSQRRLLRVLNLFRLYLRFSPYRWPRAGRGRVTNVDVSARYLEWGKRNLALNGLDPSTDSRRGARFFRMDAFAYLAYAERHPEERFDLVILDPPTFAVGDRRRGVKPWKALADYPALVQAARAGYWRPAASYSPRRTRGNWPPLACWRALVTEALGCSPAWQTLPPWPADVTESGRVAAVLFIP